MLKPAAPLHWGIPRGPESNARVRFIFLELGSLVRSTPTISISCLSSKSETWTHLGSAGFEESSFSPSEQHFCTWRHLGNYRKLGKLGSTCLPFVGSLLFWFSAAEKSVAKMEIKSKIFIVFLSWMNFNNRPYDNLQRDWWEKFDSGIQSSVNFTK